MSKRFREKLPPILRLFMSLRAFLRIISWGWILENFHGIKFGMRNLTTSWRSSEMLYSIPDILRNRKLKKVSPTTSIPTADRHWTNTSSLPPTLQAQPSTHICKACYQTTLQKLICTFDIVLCTCITATIRHCALHSSLYHLQRL